MDESPTLLATYANRDVDRRSVSQMLGEVMREVGVLLFVFIPLDLALQRHPLTFVWVTAIVVLPVAFLASGIWIERTRKQ